jgi:RNA polymerase sigma-70 factor (ECF subfamily)
MNARRLRQEEKHPSVFGAQTGVHYIGFDGDDESLLDALKEGQPGSKRALFDRYAEHVQRVLIRIIGIDDAIPELLSETFLQAFSNVGSVRNGGSLKAWLSMIAVFTARGMIRKRKKRRLLWLLEPKKIQDVQTYETDTDAREALKVLYEILDEMPADERIAFALRFVEGMGLREVAEACDVSLATIKRRLSRAQALFVPRALDDPLLKEWVERGERWRGK